MKKNIETGLVMLSIVGILFLLSAIIPILMRGFPLKATRSEIQFLCIGCGLFGIAIWVGEVFFIKLKNKTARVIGHTIAWSMGLSGTSAMIMALFFL